MGPSSGGGERGIEIAGKKDGKGVEADEVDDRKVAKTMNGSRYRLERFGKAMLGTASWEVPGAILSGEFSFICFGIFLEKCDFVMLTDCEFVF